MLKLRARSRVMRRGAAALAAALALGVVSASTAAALPPGAPTAVVAAPGATPNDTGPLTVSFVAPPNNGNPITSYTASCTSSTGGVPGTASRVASPIVVPNLTAGNPYLCSVTATSAGGVGPASVAARAIVGTPAAPRILRVLPLANGLALPFVAGTDNGRPIVNYRGRCRSNDGGVPIDPLQVVSPMVVVNMTAGKTYTCVINANNSRGAGSTVTVGPVVIAAPVLTHQASCTLSAGTLNASPGFLIGTARPQTLALSSTVKACTGPYVTSGRIAFSMQTPSEVTCINVMNLQNGGFGKITWTAPLAMGTAGASLRIIFTSTTGHVTKAHFFGVVTSRSNLFTNRHVTGDLTLDHGLKPTASGGDCTVQVPLKSFTVTALTFTIT